MRATRSIVVILLALLLQVSDSWAQLQAPDREERIDEAIVEKIKEEGLQRSEIMTTLSYLTDVHGPRLTGSPITRAAGQWTKEKLTEWGLQDAHLEPWGPFGRGWTIESFKANLVEPNFTPLIAYPKAWSPSTPQAIRGEPIYLDAQNEADLEKYRGKLRRAIVLISPPREVAALFDAPATRQTDEQLLRLANASGSPRGGGQRGRGGRRGGRGGRGAEPAASTAAPGAANAANADQPPRPSQAAAPAPPVRVPPQFAQSRAAMQLQSDKWQFAYDEGAGVVLEPGRGDGGNMFIASVNMPRVPTDNSAPFNPFSRGPRPWAVDAPEILPQAVLAVEHYNRIVRMLEKGAHPELEIDIACRYHTDELDSFNVVAEIPGTDLKEEVVMLGGHFDSWHAGTGATDNAVGCGVALEAVRILQAIGAKPRRTIRIALWTGEEQGLLGSRAYVAEHFGQASTPSRGERPADGQRPRRTYELKPAHQHFSAYFNLDNGTGKVRGVYLQGNEQLRPVFRAWLGPFNDMGAATLTSSNTGGTDHLSFDAIGLPGFQFIQDPLEYDTRTHHSSMDVYERIQEEDVKQAAVIMASFVYHAAMRNEQLPRKPLDGEIVQAQEKVETAPAGAGAR